MLRIQLINEKVGSIIEEQGPVDITELSEIIKRSSDSPGIVYELVLDVEFVKGSREFLKTCYYTAGGLDAVVIVNVYEYDTNLRRWELAFTGQVNFNKRELREDRIIVNIEQTGVEQRVKNLMDVDVPLSVLESKDGTSLPAINTELVPMHSKTIVKQYVAAPASDIPVTLTDVIFYEFGACEIGPCDRDRDSTVYGTIDTTTVTKEELDGTFSQGWGTSEAVKPLTHQATEKEVTNINISVRTKFYLEAIQSGASGDIDVSSPCSSSGILAGRELRWWFEHQDSQGNIKTLTQFGIQTTIEGCGSSSVEGDYETHTYQADDVQIEPGDKLMVYWTLRIYGTYTLTGGVLTGRQITHNVTITPDMDSTFINLVAKTSIEETSTEVYLLYEAFERCVQYYTNQVDCFRSTLLGRTDLGYPADGKGSLVAWTNGGRLRGDSREVFANLKQLLEFVRVVYCADFGFEVIDGKKVMVVEELDYFYNKNVQVLSLGSVFEPVANIDAKRFFNSVIIGYTTKIDMGQINAIEEFNTTRTYVTSLSNTSNKLTVTTDVVTAGYAIEYQRRLRVSTEDGKYDDNNFAISLVRSGGGFKSKKNEGYTSITNITDPATGYNYDFSPARVLQSWFKVIGSSLIYSTDKTLKFSSGLLNYEMITNKEGDAIPIKENGTFDVSNVEPIWDNEIYDFEVKLTRAELKLLKATPYGVFSFKDRFGETFEGFLSADNSEHEFDANSMAFKLLKVYRP